MVTYDTYITAAQVCELIEKIAALGLMGLKRSTKVQSSIIVTE
jgi:hypothetical protein